MIVWYLYVTCSIMRPLGIYQIVCCSPFWGWQSKVMTPDLRRKPPRKQHQRNLCVTWRTALPASRTSTSSRRDRDHEIWGWYMDPCDDSIIYNNSSDSVIVQIVWCSIHAPPINSETANCSFWAAQRSQTAGCWTAIQKLTCGPIQSSSFLAPFEALFWNDRNPTKRRRNIQKPGFKKGL